MPAPADLIFTGGRVHTVDPAMPAAQAVAVAGERIVAVGSADDISEFRGPSTEVIDLTGKLLLPGFQDSHIHPPSAGMDMLRCDLTDIVDRDEVLATIKAYAESHPDEPWILGGNWSMETFPGGCPTAAELDTVVSDRPVFFPNRDGHDGWANSKALELAHITASTPDPDDGRIERDAQGNPTGTLHEGAMDLVIEVSPEPQDSFVEKGILKAQAHLHALGITAWQDAIVDDHGIWGSSLDPYAALARAGKLTGRVIGAIWWDRKRGLEQIDQMMEHREKYSGGRFQATSVKIMQDGIIENGSAGMLEPYCAHDTIQGNGMSFIDPEVLNEAAARLDREGFQMHIHAIGDRGVREALDAIEAAATANGSVDPRDLRHHIAHIQVINPTDVPRFAKLKAVANAQPLWACHEAQMNELTIPLLGDVRSAQQYPFKSLLRSGARLAFGSDWAVSTANPLEEMEVAITRQDPATRLEPLLPDEALTVDEALHAFTMGTAYVNHLDGETGSVTVGKFADLCVVDQDLFEIPEGRLSQATVEMTTVGGETVFRSDSL